MPLYHLLLAEESHRALFVDRHEVVSDALHIGARPRARSIRRAGAQEWKVRHATAKVDGARQTDADARTLRTYNGVEPAERLLLFCWKRLGELLCLSERDTPVLTDHRFERGRCHHDAPAAAGMGCGKRRLQIRCRMPTVGGREGGSMFQELLGVTYPHSNCPNCTHCCRIRGLLQDCCQHEGTVTDERVV